MGATLVRRPLHACLLSAPRTNGRQLFDAPTASTLPHKQAEVDALERELFGAARFLHAKLEALHEVLTPAQAFELERAMTTA